MQHDGKLEDQRRDSFRLDTQAAVQALMTNNSGNDAPLAADSYPFQTWVDADAKELRMRDEVTNTKWWLMGWVNKLFFGLLPRKQTKPSVATVSGVLTLNGLTDFISATGAENVTALSLAAESDLNVQFRLYRIQWASARTIVHSANLQLQGAVNRAVAANSISTFLHDDDGKFYEVGYSGY
jgi:hypothetical protein